MPWKRDAGGRVLANIGRNAMIRAQNYRCGICGHPLKGRPANVEHVWPLSEFKKHSQTGNHVIAHTECNVLKADAAPTPCQVLFLAATNRAMGHNERKTEMWDRRKGSRSSCPAR